MELIFLFDGILFLLISFLFLTGFLKHYKKKNTRQILTWFSYIGIGYIILDILFFFIFFGLTDFFERDIEILFFIVIAVQSLLIFFIFYSLNRKNYLAFALAGYALLMAALSIYFHPYFFLIASYFFLTFLFGSIRTVSRNISEFGIIYSASSMILSALYFFGFENILFLCSVSSLLFLLLVHSFQKEIPNLEEHITKKIKREPGYLVLFVKYFIFIVVLTSIVFMSVLMGHEFGHIIAAEYYGCESRSIFYESGNSPYTEVLCPDSNAKFLEIIAGFAFPIFIVALLFIVGGKFMREIAVLALGFNLLISYTDFKEAGMGALSALSTTILGGILLILGIIVLAKSRVEEFPGSLDY